MPAETPIQVRRGTASAWTTANPTLLAGELGFETDTLKFKIGNGSSTWTALSYQGGGGGVTVQETAPLSPSVGNLWYNTDTGQTFIYYDGFWSEVGPTPVDSVLTRIGAKGDILVATSANTVTSVPVGVNGTVIMADSSQSSGVRWAALDDDQNILANQVFS